MRLSKQRLVMIGAAVTIVIVAVMVTFGWWQGALVALAALQVAGIVILLDTRHRMARAHAMRDLTKQVTRTKTLAEKIDKNMAKAPAVRKLAADATKTQKSVNTLGTRTLAATETSRVEVADHMSRLERTLNEHRAGLGGIQIELSTLTRQLNDSKRDLNDLSAQLKHMNDLAVAVEQSLNQAEQDMPKKLRLAGASQLRQTEALLQLYQRVQPRSSMPTGSWALKPTELLTLLEVIENRQPGLVLELGSGVSTVWLGYTLKKLGTGRLVSIEHDDYYADTTRSWLRTHDLEDVVDLRLAPLVDPKLPGHETPWYDHTVFDDLTGIDALIVDGPPQATGTLARYPALPKLISQLSPHACILLDDAHRPDEKDSAQRWTENYPLTPVNVEPSGRMQVFNLANG